MLMKVARPVWGGAVGNGLLVNERATPLVYHNTALAAYSTVFPSIKAGQVHSTISIIITLSQD
jgi:hypothetical protein